MHSCCWRWTLLGLLARRQRVTLCKLVLLCKEGLPCRLQVQYFVRDMEQHCSVMQHIAAVSCTVMWHKGQLKQQQNKCLVHRFLPPQMCNLGMQLQLIGWYAFNNSLSGTLPSAWSNLSHVSQLSHIQVTGISDLLFADNVMIEHRMYRMHYPVPDISCICMHASQRSHDSVGHACARADLMVSLKRCMMLAALGVLQANTIVAC